MTRPRFTDCAPVFVVGAGRSGTTLLQLLINAHPDFAIFGELHFFTKILEIRPIVPSLEREVDRKRFFRIFRRSAATARYVVGADDLFDKVEERLAHIPQPTYEHFFRPVMEEYARSKQGQGQECQYQPANSGQRQGTR